jgi:hypothetical protein
MKKKLLIITVFLSLISPVQSQISWDSSIDIAINTYSNMMPRMALNAAGNPMLVWGKMADASVLFSRWNGSMFTTPVKLNPPWLKVATASWMGPDIASHGDTVYVVVKRAPEISDTNRLFVFTSFNGGVSFNAPVQLAFIADSISRLPTITTDETGNPLVAYMKFNASFLDSRWVVTKSTDYGRSFTTDVKVSGWGNSDEVCDCCPGAIVSAGNKSLMLYRDENKNIRDIWASLSTNNAASFPIGFKVDNNNWLVMSCPSSGPDAVVVGDTLYTTFMSSGSGNYRTYLSKSSISTGAMGSIQNLTGAITGLSQQNYPRIATDVKAMAVVWKQTVSGASQLPIRFTNNIAKGLPAAYDTVDLADITNADVALSNGKVFVVWQDDKAGTVKYRSGTYTPSAGITELLKRDITVFPNPFSFETTFYTDEPFQEASLVVYNDFGQMVRQTKHISGTTFALQRDNLPAGIYFAQMTEKGKVLLTDKLIIIKY